MNSSTRNIVFTGESDTIRSTFINSLLGFPILPVRSDSSPIPIVKISGTKDADEAGVFINYSSDDKPHPLDRWNHLPVNQKNIEYIEIIVHNHPLLKRKFEIWDLPADTASNKQHTAKVRDLFSKGFSAHVMNYHFTRTNRLPEDIFLRDVYKAEADKFCAVVDLENLTPAKQHSAVWCALEKFRLMGISSPIVPLSLPGLPSYYVCDMEMPGISEVVQNWQQHAISIQKYLSKPKRKVTGTELYSQIERLSDIDENFHQYRSFGEDTLMLFAVHDDPEAQFMLAELNSIVDNDMEMHWLNRAAENGHAGAQYILGKLYEIGKGVEQSIEKAFEWFQKAADQDYAPAQSEFHNLVPENEISELRLYSFHMVKRAAIQGNAEALYRMGTFYEEGHSVKVDLEIAFRSYSKASGNGHPDAMAKTGKMLLEGRGVEQNEELGFQLLRLAAENDSALGAEELGKCYLSGTGTEMDEKLALECFEKALKINNKASLKSIVALCYLADNVCEGKEEEGLALAHSAALEGDSDAYLILANYYLSNFREIANEKIGTAYLLKAVEHKIPAAQFLLGECLIAGRGMEKDAAAGLKWINAAAENGDENAIAYLLSNGYDVPKQKRGE